MRSEPEKFLPRDVFERCDNAADPLRDICDYVAGMTELLTCRPASGPIQVIRSSPFAMTLLGAPVFQVCNVYCIARARILGIFDILKRHVMLLPSTTKQWRLCP